MAETRSMWSTLPDPANVLGMALLKGNHFNYVTNDTDAANAALEAIGIGPWSHVPGAASDESSIKASFAPYAGRLIELTEALPEQPSLPADHADPDTFYDSLRAERVIWPLLARDGLSIELHDVTAHLDVTPRSVIDAAVAAGLGWEILRRREPAPGDIVVVDTRAVLGHWIKVVCSSELED